MKVGIPGGLFYYCYYPLWKMFFEELGAEVITSGGTNKATLNFGVKLCVDEACLPVKVYHGHVKSLADKVDALFIPRIMSICRNEYICPKFCGLPEMVKYSVPAIPHMIDTTVNLRKSEGSLIDSLMNAANIISKNRTRVLNAYKSALGSQLRFEERLKMTGDFNTAVSGDRMNKASNGRRIALLGHPYLIYDSYINMNVIGKLSSQGYMVVTTEMIDDARINRSAERMPKRHFWTLGRKILGAGLSFLEYRDVDGIIYVSSFGCGIDSLIEDYLERHIRRDGRIPYMKLTLDEHSGEAGIDTRIEAFIDMVKRREEYEGNISTYGRGLCSDKRFS